MVYDIVTKENDVLRHRTTPVSLAFLTSREGQRLIADMVETMRAANGIGLAAPQIGKPIQLAVIAFKDHALTIANPAIRQRSFRKQTEEEGCLSIPGVFGKVKRHQQVTLAFTDEHGEQQTVRADGLFARVIQHEVDHLDGTLYIDRTTQFTQGHP